VRVLADRQIHRQMQTDFIICTVLYAIAMGQIITNITLTRSSTKRIDSRAVFVRFSLGGGQSFNWRLAITAGMEVAKFGTVE